MDSTYEEFRRLLKQYRSRRRWSQERLAEKACMDHSLVSRVESGDRPPTRDAVTKLARGLELYPVEADEFLVAAGYAPNNPANAISDPDLRRLVNLLQDPNVPAEVHEQVIAVVRQLTLLAQRAIINATMDGTMDLTVPIHAHPLRAPVSGEAHHSQRLLQAD